MTNDQMKRDRFGRWAHYRARVRDIEAALRAGKRVFLTTYGGGGAEIRPTTPIRATPTSFLVRHGKRWIDYTYTKLWITK